MIQKLLKINLTNMLLKTVFFILTFFLITGSLTAQDLNPDYTQRDSSELLLEKFKNGIDFYANGNEPFWGLNIAMNQFIRFKELEGVEVDLGPVTAEKAMDANVIRFAQQTEKGFFKVTVSQQECFDDMSGEKFDYRVIVELNNPGDPDYRKFDGCGNYVPDYRLNRTWILKQIGNDEVEGSSYTKGAPEITFDIGKDKFSGSGGCNRIFGSLYSEYNILRFGDIASTMMLCPGLDKEKQFIKSLEKVVSYELSGNQLSLSNPDGLLMILYDPTLEGNKGD